MTKKNKGFKNFKLLWILLAVLLVQGCSGNGSKTTNGSPTSKETLNKTTGDNQPIKLSMLLSDDNLVNVFKEYNKKFQEIHPNVEFDIIKVPYDKYEEKLKEIRNAGTALDIVQLWPGAFKNLRKDNYVVDLESFLKLNAISKDETLFDGISKMMTVNGKLLAIPAYIDNLNIFYNKQWFDEAKVPYPKDGWLWADFADSAKRLQVAKKDPEKYGSMIPFNMDFIEPFVMGKGGSFFSEDGTTTKGYLDSKASVDAFKWVSDFIRVDKLSPIITGEDSVVKSIAALKNNSAAMVMNWSSFANYDKDLREGIKNGQYGIIGLPKFADGKRVNSSLTFGLGIMEKSANQKMAWEYIQGLTVKPLQVTKTMSDNGFIGTKALVNGLENMEKDPNKQVIFGEFQFVKANAYYKETDWYNIQNRKVNSILETFIKGNDKAEQLLPSLSGAIELELGLNNKK